MKRFLRKYVARLYYWFLYQLFEKPKGIDFVRKYDEFSKHNSTASMHSMLPEKTLRLIFHGLKISSDYTILDIGCGKGFALFIMTKLGFNRAHGIELLPNLCKIAKKNIFVLKLENKITVECVDATIFKNLDEYIYIHMFNPFPASIMQKVVQNIENSLKRKPRNLIIIYSNPTCHEILANSDFLEFYEKRFVVTRLAKILVHYYRHNMKVE